MKDDRLISLNAALDVLHGYFDGMLETDTVCPKDLYNEIEALPSAQSEPKSYRMGYQAGYAAAQRWTPVTEKLPSKPGNYLVTVSLMIGDYVKSEFFDGDDFDDWDEEVRAWMPLPKSYREVEQE